MYVVYQIHLRQVLKESYLNMRTKNLQSVVFTLKTIFERVTIAYSSREERQKNTPLKTLTMLGIGVMAINVVLGDWSHQYGSAVISLISCGFLVAAHALNVYGQKNLSKILVIFTFNATFFLLSHVEGLKSGSYLYFFPIIFAMIFIIDVKISQDLIITEAITLMCLGLTFIIAPYESLIEDKPSQSYLFLFRLNLSISLILTALFSYFILRALEKNENEILDEKLLGDTIYNTSLDATYIIDMEKNIVVDCNKRALELFGFKEKEQILHSPVVTVLGTETDQRIKSFSKDNFVRHSPWFGNMEFIRKDQTSIYAYANIVLFSHKQKSFSKISILDITEIKIAEVETLKAKEKAERAAKVKSRFLSNMSHELRTPLNAIIGTTNILVQEEYLPTQKPFFDVLKHSSEHMMQLVNDVLDFSKLEAEKMQLENAPFSLKDFLDKTITVFRSAIEKKKVDFIINTDSFQDIEIIGDELRLNQVLNNLISNSVKFTEKGNVTLTASTITKRSNDIIVYFSVSDTGIGIAQDKLNKVFASFYQTDLETTRKYGGSGLGLAISKYIVNKMGSDLKVSSELGKGSCFHFTINFKINNVKQPYVQEKSGAIQNDLTGKRILLAEDNPVNMMVARRFLQKWNADVDEAVNGLEAVELYNKNHYDLLLVDLEMPEMDGSETVSEIRKTNNNIPIIAFTAAVYDNMYADLIEKGFTDFIPKPFRPEDLNNKIFKHIQAA